MHCSKIASNDLKNNKLFDKHGKKHVYTAEH